MAFEPTYEKVVSGFRKKLGTTQAVIECRLPANEGKVGTILCVNAASYVVGCEVVDNVVSFNGYVSFHAVYENEHSQPEGLDYTAEFRDKFTSDDAYNVLTPIVTSTVIDIQSTPQENEIKVVAILEIAVDGVVGEEASVLVSLDNNNSYTLKEKLNYTAFHGTVNHRLDISHDTEILDSVGRVLSVCPTAYIERVTPADKYLSVVGGVNFDICYLCDNGTIRTLDAHCQFAEEVANEHITPESSVQSMVNVLLNEIKITTALDVDRAEVSVEFPIRFSGFIFNPHQLDVISDVFNCNHYLNVDYQNLNIQRNLPPIELVERITADATLDENMPFMDEVLGSCCNRVVLANTAVQDGRLLLEGVAYTTVIYLNKEENKTLSMQVEMPFSIMSSISDVSDNFRPVVSVAMGDLSAKGKRGKEIDINAKLYIYVDFFKIESDVVISNIAQSDEKIIDDLVLTIYIAKDGDTVWEIAKEMNLSPDVILEQNADLEFPVAAGTRVVCYRQRLADY